MHDLTTRIHMLAVPKKYSRNNTAYEYEPFFIQEKWTEDQKRCFIIYIQKKIIPFIRDKTIHHASSFHDFRKWEWRYLIEDICSMQGISIDTLYGNDYSLAYI